MRMYKRKTKRGITHIVTYTEAAKKAWLKIVVYEKLLQSIQLFYDIAEIL